MILRLLRLLVLWVWALVWWLIYVPWYEGVPFVVECDGGGKA